MLLNWKEKPEWIAELGRAGRRILTHQIQADLLASPPEYCWSDDASWLPDQTVFHRFEGFVFHHFTHIRTHHGCRPVNLDSYLRKGLLGQDQCVIEGQFREIFRDLPDDRLNDAIAALRSPDHCEAGKVYLCGNDRELVERSGHYLIQGSEYLMGLAARLCDSDRIGEDYTLRLRRVGTPTILTVDLPLEQIPAAQRKELAMEMLASWGNQLLGLEQYDNPMCLVVHSSIHPRHIAGHYHPREIRDPHFPGTSYINHNTTCDHC